MDVANLPVPTDNSSIPDRFADHLGEQLAKGVHPRELATKIYPKHADRGKRLHLYRRLKRLALGDARVHAALTDDVKLDMMVALGPTVRAMAGRAARGRTDAGKLILEASGFHNPRVKHDHSGDINVRLTIPRPTREPAIDGEAEVVD